jgi:hypothetical protein
MLGGSRNRAQQVLHGADIDLSGHEFLLNGEILVAAAVGFTDELVAEILVRRDAAELQLLACSEEFVDAVMERAEVYGVESRVKVVS